MKKLALMFGLVILGLSLVAQELQHESAVVNIEVPVRVFKGDQFIDNLKINDFQLFEDGVLQNIEAVYMIKKTTIKREEAHMEKEAARKIFAPRVGRQFVLIFEVIDYMQDFGDMFRNFFTNIISPEDSLVIITPEKTYNMNSEVLRSINPEIIAQQLVKIVRKDIIMGNTEYHNIVNELMRIFLDSLGFGRLFAHISMYVENLYNMWINLKSLEEERILSFANYLKRTNGQKHVFLFYQKEVLPQFNEHILSAIQTTDQKNYHYYSKMSDLFTQYKREPQFDVKHIKEAFSDSSISCHFLYLTKTPSRLSGPEFRESTALTVSWKEKSEDIFSAFSEIAKATGGIVDSSLNPSYLFKKAIDATENYYLLYYSPRNYKSDGTFRDIEVKVEGKNFKVLHRAGYISD